MHAGEGFWWYVTLEGREEDAEVLASLVELSGSIGAEYLEGVGRSRARAYYRSSQDLGYWLRRLNEALEPWPGVAVVDMGKVENRQWHTAWKEAFPPLSVGERLVVLAPWHRGSEPTGRLPLYIYPGSAFGTGYHESTQIMLELLERHCRGGAAVADIGSGSGILGIAAVKLGAARAWCRDLDPAVLPEIEENCRLNDIPKGILKAEVGDLLKGFRHRVDLLLANIVREPLLEMLPDVRGVLEKGGKALFSGLVGRERDEFLVSLKMAGLIQVDEIAKGEWWGVAASPAA